MKPLDGRIKLLMRELAAARTYVQQRGGKQIRRRRKKQKIGQRKKERGNRKRAQQKQKARVQSSSDSEAEPSSSEAMFRATRVLRSPPCPRPASSTCNFSPAKPIQWSHISGSEHRHHLNHSTLRPQLEQFQFTLKVSLEVPVGFFRSNAQSRLRATVLRRLLINRKITHQVWLLVSVLASLSFISFVIVGISGRGSWSFASA